MLSVILNLRSSLQIYTPKHAICYGWPERSVTKADNVPLVETLPGQIDGCIHVAALHCQHTLYVMLFQVHVPAKVVLDGTSKVCGRLWRLEAVLAMRSVACGSEGRHLRVSDPGIFRGC